MKKKSKTKQRAQIENLTPPNITRTEGSKKWIHNQEEKFICQALTSSPDSPLKGLIFEGQTNVGQLKALKRQSQRRGDVYQVTTVFRYIVDRKDENRHVLCTVVHKDERSNVLTPSNRMESNRIAIEEVNFPPSSNSIGQSSIGLENISFTVLANPGPRSDQIHLLTCFDSECQDEKDFSFEELPTAKPLGNASENEEHLMDHHDAIST
ncbi:uncharacterized protein LOC131887427 [Tigriopus californicus]|nr:uncharacterized protein LOC131887427 [Tigriopus californicus]